MSCNILKGAPVAAAIDEKTAELVSRLIECGTIPTLAIVRVGENESDLAYERAVVKRCARLGIETRLAALTAKVTQPELIDCIRALNDDHGIHGIIVLRPLPKELDALSVCGAISPEKDVDGVCPESMARVYSGVGRGFTPCTAQSCMEILAHYNIPLESRNVVVLGRSLVVGKPAAMLFSAANANVTMLHSKSGDYAELMRRADIIISAIGLPEHLGAEYFSPGQIVIDTGMSWYEAKNRFTGDVDFEAAQNVVSALTPVPGGVGSVTTAVLALHLAQAAENNT